MSSFFDEEVEPAASNVHERSGRGVPPLHLAGGCALMVAAVAVAAISVGVDALAGRVFLLVFVPLLPCFFSRGRVLLQRARRARAAHIALAPTVGLEEARRTRVATVCTGRIRCSKLVVAPRTSERCAGYVARRPDRHWGTIVHSEMGGAALETESHGLVPLEPGPWEVVDPFDTDEVDAEARLEDGAVVSIRAHVESCLVADAGYRGSFDGYRLRASGGRVFPARGRFSHRIVKAHDPNIAAATQLSVLAAAVGALILLLGR
ncbi:MAG: hypothetical protein HOW73_04845 [Polyangiaceae bacterium]|nr:hypothetical protein [Polyangiaceae bacterium]